MVSCASFRSKPSFLKPIEAASTNAKNKPSLIIKRSLVDNQQLNAIFSLAVYGARFTVTKIDGLLICILQMKTCTLRWFMFRNSSNLHCSVQQCLILFFAKILVDIILASNCTRYESLSKLDAHPRVSDGDESPCHLQIAFIMAQTTDQICHHLLIN